jgi:hypothetical protein
MMNIPSASENLVVVSQANDLLHAELLKASLEEAGIECLVTNRNQGSFAGLALIPVELSVAAADVERARLVIAADQHANEA